MKTVSTFLPNDGFVGDGGPRLRVLLCQLALSFAMALCVGAAGTFSTDILDDGVFLLSLDGHALLLAACIAIPWDRMLQGRAGPQQRYPWCRAGTAHHQYHH